MKNVDLINKVKFNCDISDARDSGIYSICTLVLKLRNLYKWENGLEPWQEPDSQVLLDWIAAKEEYWESIQDEEFLQIPVNGEKFDPFSLSEVNRYLASENHVYGAGYGRSMKAVFFLAEILEERVVDGCQAFILGEERARELSSPFAMLQDRAIFIRKEPLRFFFWDQIQEINYSSRISMQQALSCYGLTWTGNSVDRKRLISKFDTIIDRELDIFIYHEVGENQKNLLNGNVLKKIIAAYPATAIELVARAVKDILADTHPKGLLGHIIAGENKSSLGFYLSFLDGMRKLLCPDIVEAGKKFWKNSDWSLIERARLESRRKNEIIAVELQSICNRLDDGEPSEDIRIWAEKHVLAPLGLNVPARGEEST